MPIPEPMMSQIQRQAEREKACELAADQQRRFVQSLIQQARDQLDYASARIAAPDREAHFAAAIALTKAGSLLASGQMSILKDLNSEIPF